MASCSTTIKASKVMRGFDLVVTVTGIRKARLRLKCGMLLMRLAAWVGGVGFRVEDDG